MASAAPPRHSSPRHTVHSPADSDQSIMPTPKIAPTTMNAQGLTSYRVWGVQERIAQDSTAASVPAGFVYNCAWSFNLAHLAEERPWAAELVVAGIGLLLGVTLMPVLIFYAGVAALGPLRWGKPGAPVFQPVCRPARGLHRLVGGVFGAVWPISSFQGPAGLVARQRPVDLDLKFHSARTLTCHKRIPSAFASGVAF